jgi:hypothetical protein
MIQVDNIVAACTFFVGTVVEISTGPTDRDR